MDPDWDLELAADPELVLTVARAARRFLEEVGPQQIVFGIGIAPARWCVKPVPMILVDSMIVEVAEILEVPVFSAAEIPPIVPLGDVIARGGAAERLLGWELPSETAVVPVTRPQPVSATLPLDTGDAIRGPSLVRGTVGPPVLLKGSMKAGFLTAGHVTGTNAGAVVERLRWRRFRSRVREPIGQVIHASDPVETPHTAGYDIAVLQHLPGVRTRMKSRTVAHLPATIAAPHTARLLGGVSGAVPAALIGALMMFGDSTRLWKNSWIMIPSGVATFGDSGSAVIDANGDLLGILVGGSLYVRSTAMAIQYVQDAESIEREHFRPLGVQFG